jgi:hypothetical protein
VSTTVRWKLMAPLALAVGAALVGTGAAQGAARTHEAPGPPIDPGSCALDAVVAGLRDRPTRVIGASHNGKDQNRRASIT